MRNGGGVGIVIEVLNVVSAVFAVAIIAVCVIDLRANRTPKGDRHPQREFSKTLLVQLLIVGLLGSAGLAEVSEEARIGLKAGIMLGSTLVALVASGITVWRFRGKRGE